MKRRAAMPLLYQAMFDLSAMRSQLAALSPDLGEPQTRQLLSRIEAAETIAVRLMDVVEAGRVACH